MSKTLTAANQAIVDAIRAQGSFADDHGYKGDRQTPYIYLVFEDTDRKGDARQSICPTSSDYFCINPTYLGEDGRVRLSQWSVGGTVDMGRKGGMKRFSMVERCRRYNETLEGADPRLGISGRITGLIYFSGPLKPKVTWL